MDVAGVYNALLCFSLTLFNGVLSLRCYECNPSASGYSIGSPSSVAGSTYGTSSSATDCYNPDARQIKDCSWDIQSCYTVVLPGSQAGGVAPAGTYNQAQGQFGTSQNIPYGNPYASNSGLTAQRGCGKYPGIFEVGDEECRLVTLPGTSTRATVCNCRSDSCNNRRPDQVTNPLTGNQPGVNTGFYPNAPPAATQYGPNPIPPPGSGQFAPGTNYPPSAYGPAGASPYGPTGTQYHTGQYGAYGSGYYGNQQPGAQYPYPNANPYGQAGQQPPPYYAGAAGQPSYPGYAIPPPAQQQYPNSQYPSPAYQGQGNNYNLYTDPYAAGRYGGTGTSLRSRWILYASTLVLLVVAVELVL